MADNINDFNISFPDPDLERLRLNKESGYMWRERRHADWTENYTLYRDKVQINRLTQRQSVNIPLMKTIIRSMLKDVDDLPLLYFENLDNDKQKELLKNEYWSETTILNKLELKDIVDKKQVFLFGRSFTQLNVVDGQVRLFIEDPQDFLVDRYMDPTDLDSARFLIHTHIFRPLWMLQDNKLYDQNAVNELRHFYATRQGLIKSADNRQMLMEKNERMAAMGVSDIDHPELGETYVELSLHLQYERVNGKDILYRYIEAENERIIAKDPLDEIIGKTKDNYWQTHYNYTTWADDLERTDFWSDGIADTLRTSNKVLNSWFSQLIENRTMRNFGMHYFNSNLDGFNPQTFTPGPWGWYPLPVPSGMKISDVMQKVDIPDLSESLDEMKFIMDISERATGGSSAQQGVQNPKQLTLGEFKGTLMEAKQRVQSMAKFYIPSWQERGYKFVKLVEAAKDKLDDLEIFRKGKTGSNIYSRTIGPNDYASKSSYRCKVWSKEEKDAEDVNGIQKLRLVRMEMFDNPKLVNIYKKKLLNFADLTPDETREVMEFEEQKMDMIPGGPMVQPGMPGQPGMPMQGGAQPLQLPAPAA